MLRGLLSIEDGGKVLPFVRMFHGQRSIFLWEDEVGDMHDIPQGKGCEQGDPLMPLLFSLAQHAALVATQEQLRPGEFLFAFLDDIYIVCLPDRVGDIQEELYRHARISIHLGKTKVWNSGGEESEACATLQVAARNVDPTATVWRGDPTLPVALQGVKPSRQSLLAVPLSNPACARQAQCENDRSSTAV